MIIGDGIILGSGGETARIQVSGVSQTDTVTCTKDGKRYKGIWFSEQKQIQVDKEIPKMTSNTTPSGVASSTSDYSADFVAWKAFDKNDVGTPGWSPPYNASLSNTYCQYEFTKPIVPTKIQIGFGGNGYSFTVKASLDGTSWDTLASNISNSRGNWSTKEISTNSYYKYYRFYMIGASNGTGAGDGHKFNVIGYIEEDKYVSGYEFTVNQYGTYTITATDGTNIKTQDVLVDAAEVFTVEVTL